MAAARAEREDEEEVRSEEKKEEEEEEEVGEEWEVDDPAPIQSAPAIVSAVDGVAGRPGPKPDGGRVELTAAAGGARGAGRPLSSTPNGNAAKPGTAQPSALQPVVSLTGVPFEIE